MPDRKITPIRPEVAEEMHMSLITPFHARFALKVFLLAILFGLAAVSSTLAQTNRSKDYAAVSAQVRPTSPPRRDPEAITLLAASVNGMGIDSAVSQIPVCRATGAFILGEHKGSFKWTNEGSEFRYEAEMEGRTDVYVSGHGQPTASIDGQIHKPSPHMGMADVPSHLAAFLLRSYLHNEQFRLEFRNNFRIGNQLVNQITAADHSSRLRSTFVQTWTIDPQTKLPFIIEYKVPTQYNAARLITFRDQLSGFERFGGVLFPKHIDRFLDDRLVASFDIENVQCGGSASAGEFELGGVQQ